MKRRFLLAATVAALSLSAGIAGAQPGNAGRVALERGGIAAQEAKVKLKIGFAQPYYSRSQYDQPYRAPSNSGPDQD